MRGDIFLDLEMFDRAIKDYDKAIELEPRKSEFYFDKGYALYSLEKFDQAVEFFEKSVKIKEDDNTYYNLACCYVFLKNSEKALKNLEKAIEINSDKKRSAKEDPDFENLRMDSDFIKLTT